MGARPDMGWQPSLNHGTSTLAAGDCGERWEGSLPCGESRVTWGGPWWYLIAQWHFVVPQACAQHYLIGPSPQACKQAKAEVNRETRKPRSES